MRGVNHVRSDAEFKKFLSAQEFSQIFHFLSCVFGIKSVNMTKRTIVDVSHHFHIQLVIQNYGGQRREGGGLYPHARCGGSFSGAIRQFITPRGGIFPSGGKTVESAKQYRSNVSLGRQSAQRARTCCSRGSISPRFDRKNSSSDESAQTSTGA